MSIFLSVMALPIAKAEVGKSLSTWGETLDTPKAEPSVAKVWTHSHATRKAKQLSLKSIRPERPAFIGRARQACIFYYYYLRLNRLLLYLE